MDFSGVRVTRSLVLCVCFDDCCLSFCTFSFGHFVFCSSSIYGFRFSSLPKEKEQKDKQQSSKHTHKTKDRVTRTPLKSIKQR
jgi:hypothetical protein